jgi:transposase
VRRPRSVKELGFSGYDIARLRRGLRKAKDKRVYQRVQGVLLVALGRGVSEVAEVSGVSEKAVYGWIGRYLSKHRIESLEDAPRSGRPSVAAKITPVRIVGELRRNPLHLGYRTTVWTVSLLARHLSQRYGCSISTYTLRRRMKSLGLSCRRPRYFYEEKDPHRTQKKGLSSDD